MTARQLLSELRRYGVSIRIADGRVQVVDPDGALPEDLRHAIDAQEEQLRLFLAEIDAASVQPPPLVPSVSDDPPPASFAQEWLLFLDALDSARTNYLVPLTLRLEGPLSVEALAASLNAIVRRHAVLRTVVRLGGRGPEQVVEAATPVALPVSDWSAWTAAARAAALAVAQAEEAAQPFDVGRGPLLRARLVRLSSDEAVLLLTVHHMVFDDWSLGVLLRELAVLYPAYAAGAEPTLPPLPVQYADYARWQRQWLSGPVLEEAVAHWRQVLAGAPPVLDLPTDRPRPAVLDGAGALLPVTLPPELVQGLRRLSRQEDVTLFMTLLTAWQVVLARWSGQADVVVGVPVAGRAAPELEALIGCFINTLPLRVRLAETLTVREALAQVRETALAAYAHQSAPFMGLVEALAPVREASRTPLVQVGFDLHNTPAPQLTVGPLQVTPLAPPSRGAKLDLFLILEETAAGGLVGGVEYRPALFDAATVARLAGHLETVLHGMVAAPAQPLRRLPLLTAAEQTELVVTRNATAAPYPATACVHTLIAAQQTRTPTRPAVVAADGTLSYATLEARANQLAHTLQAWGVGRGTRVAVAVPRTTALPVALLGILKAGAAFVPLDPEFPAERVRYVLEDSAAPVLVTVAALQARWPLPAGLRVLALDEAADPLRRAPTTPPPSTVTADDLCYLIYTSGSTGRPKGVLVPHRGLVNHACAVARLFDLRPIDRVLQLASPAFDVALEEMVPAWLAGAAVVMNNVDDGLDRFTAALQTSGVTVANLPSPLWQAWAEQLARGEQPVPQSLRLVVIGSDRASARAVAQWLRLVNGVALLNGYGVSEATISTLFSAIPRGWEGAEVPIGRPIANTRAYVLGSAMELVPEGVAGELCIGGAGVARGYVGAAAETAERFVPDPYGGEAGGRLYRTGDRVRWGAGGELEFLGRLDAQVKIRGYRAEPAEVEAVLGTMPAVQGAAVVARAGRVGPELVAYVVPHGEEQVSAAAVTAWLGARLPGYLVPQRVVSVTALPLTRNGKVDRVALAARADGTLEAARRGTPPRTPLEELVAGVWAELLELRAVGREDDFFELGGHSLLAMRAAARLRQATGREVPLRLLFEQPTVAGLADALATLTPGAVPFPPLGPAAAASPDDVPPLSFAQESLWDVSMLVPRSPYSKVQTTLDLRGPLDTRSLVASLSEIVRRHEVLRTAFVQREDRLELELHPAPELSLITTDIRSVEPSAQRAAVRAAQIEEASCAFNLAHDVLLRARLLLLAPDMYVLILTVHHLAFDGWSMGVLIDELAALYPLHARRDAFPILPDLPLQYRDFARWQRRWMREPDGVKALEYWRGALRDAPTAMRLPTDHPRGVSKTFQYGVVGFEIAGQRYRELQVAAELAGASLFMICVSALFALLHERTGHTDHWAAAVTSVRPSVELESLIGCFVNTLIIRADLAGCVAFPDVVARVRRATLDAFSHQSVPFELVAKEAGIRAGDNLSSPIPVLLSFERSALPAPLDLEGLIVSAWPADCEADPISDATAIIPSLFDLILEAYDDGRRLKMDWKYNADLFVRATVAEMAARFGDFATATVLQDSRTSLGQRPL